MPRWIKDSHKVLTGLENAIFLLQTIHRSEIETTAPDGDPVAIAECEAILTDAVNSYLVDGHMHFATAFRQDDGSRVLFTFAIDVKPPEPGDSENGD